MSDSTIDSALNSAIIGWDDGKWEMPKWEMDGKPALLVIHMQQGIAGKGTFSGGPIYQQVKDIKESGIIKKQKALLKAFREKKLPVIFVNVIPNPIGFVPSFGFIFRMIKEKKAPIGYLDNPTLRAEVEVIPEMERQPSDYLLYHTSISAFNSDLDAVLKHHCVRTVVITGYTAHSSVYNTCIRAADLWYSVIVPRDATSSPARDYQAYKAVMEQMIWMYGMVSTTDDVIAHL